MLLFASRRRLMRQVNRTRTRRILYYISLLALLKFFIWDSISASRRGYAERHFHKVTAQDIEFELTHRNRTFESDGLHGFLNQTEAEEFCGRQAWTPWPNRSERRKVYDLFMINDELDWLEIRLETLWDSVDYFVILEADRTFTGLPKALYLSESGGRFKKWESKILHHVVTDMPVGAPRTWDLEDHMRNAMFLQTFPTFPLEKKASLGDVLLVSDVDEIPRPASILLLRNCLTPRRVTLGSRFFYYGFQWEHQGGNWAHPQATIFQGLRIGETILPNDLRNGEGGSRWRAWKEKATIQNAAWHCSTCFSTVSEVLLKMKSFSHTSLNQEAFRDPTRIVDRVRKGLDLWDREGEIYQLVDVDDVPEVLKQDRERWGFVLNRDGHNAGFKDYTDDWVPGEWKTMS